jgi:hypothetical protein
LARLLVRAFGFGRGAWLASAACSKALNERSRDGLSVFILGALMCRLVSLQNVTASKRLEAYLAQIRARLGVRTDMAREMLGAVVAAIAL